MKLRSLHVAFFCFSLSKGISFSFTFRLLLCPIGLSFFNDLLLQVVEGFLRFGRVMSCCCHTWKRVKRSNSSGSKSPAASCICDIRDWICELHDK